MANKAILAPSRRSLLLSFGRYAASLAFVGISTLVALWVWNRGYGSQVGLIYLPAILAAGFWWGFGPAVLAAVASALSYDFFFTAPFYSFRIESPVDVAHVTIFLLVALVTSQLASGVQKQARIAGERGRLVELSHDAIMSRDMNNVISYLNPAAEQLYGWKLEEAVGRIAHELLGTTFPAPRDEVYAALLRDGRWEGELVRSTRHGSEVVIESHWSLLRDRYGDPVAILETDNNITERKRAQESLEEAQSELAHFNRISQMGEMTASISHEINQPISGVVTNASAAIHWLAAEPPNIEKVRSSLDRIIKDAHRASDVIGRVRALAKKKAPKKEPVDLNDTVKEALALTERQLHSSSVTLSTRFSDQLPLVRADRVQVQQVILNLISNAIEAMSTGGNDRKILVTTGREEGQLFAEITDNGPGFEEGQADKLFRSFYTTKEGGMGMGLSLCRSIIEAHGGRLTAGMNEPNGACFRFTLPLQSATTMDVT